MGGGFQFIDIIVFAVIAVFLVLRLRSVLGRRTGTEQRRDPFAGAAANDQPVRREAPAAVPDLSAKPAIATPGVPTDNAPQTPLAKGLAAIHEADSSFEQESTRLTLPWKLDDVQMRKRAMPMLFWLPVIFMSVFLEMNGYPLEADEIKDQLAA